MVTQKQTKVSAKQQTFYHRKITKAGGTRTLALGRMIPDDWLLVKCRVVKIEGKVCLIELIKLD